MMKKIIKFANIAKGNSPSLGIDFGKMKAC